MRMAAQISRAVGTAQHVATGMRGTQAMGTGRLALAGHAQGRPPGHSRADRIQEIAHLANRSGHSDPHEGKGPAPPSDEKGICF